MLDQLESNPWNKTIKLEGQIVIVPVIAQNTKTFDLPIHEWIVREIMLYGLQNALIVLMQRGHTIKNRIHDLFSFRVLVSLTIHIH